jgi:hypothetical protein
VGRNRLAKVKWASIFIIILGFFYFFFRIFGVKKKEETKEKRSSSVELYFDDGSRLVLPPDSPYYNDFQKYADELMRREENGTE